MLKLLKQSKERYEIAYPIYNEKYTDKDIMCSFV